MSWCERFFFCVRVFLDLASKFSMHIMAHGEYLFCTLLMTKCWENTRISISKTLCIDGTRRWNKVLRNFVFYWICKNKSNEVPLHWITLIEALRRLFCLIRCYNNWKWNKFSLISVCVRHSGTACPFAHTVFFYLIRFYLTSKRYGLFRLVRSSELNAVFVKKQSETYTSHVIRETIYVSLRLYSVIKVIYFTNAKQLFII